MAIGQVPSVALGRSKMVTEPWLARSEKGDAWACANGGARKVNG